MCTLSQPTGLRRVKFMNAPGRVQSCSWLCRAGKERKKEDRYALDCQERAYWLVNRTPVSRRCRHVALMPWWCPPCRPLGQSPACSGHSCGHGLWAVHPLTSCLGRGQPGLALSLHRVSPWLLLEVCGREVRSTHAWRGSYPGLGGRAPPGHCWLAAAGSRSPLGLGSLRMHLCE